MKVIRSLIASGAFLLLQTQTDKFIPRFVIVFASAIALLGNH